MALAARERAGLAPYPWRQWHGDVQLPGSVVIGIVVPAHNEAANIGRCLARLQIAAAHSALGGESVGITVVCDDCQDETESTASAGGATALCVRFRNVGKARAEGAQHALRAGARWLAFTDADSEVEADWLACQLAHQTDAVCGRVHVADWAGYPDSVIRRFDAHYALSATGEHRNVHGANLGVSAAAYLRVGGFPPLVSHEDRALVTLLMQARCSIAWSLSARVVTSARRAFRAPAGFGALLGSFLEGGPLVEEPSC